MLLGTPLLALGIAGAGVAAPNAEMSRSFERFTQSWVLGMQREAEHEGAPPRSGAATAAGTASGEYRTRRYGDVTRTRVVPTGNATAPFVGVLSYTETTWLCRPGPAAPSCEIIATTPVTEIFPYRSGAWRY
jgi:hypothetical protein